MRRMPAGSCAALFLKSTGTPAKISTRHFPPEARAARMGNFPAECRCGERGFFLPDAAKCVRSRFWNDDDRFEWKSRGVLAFLREDDGLKISGIAQRGDLPVDVEHLRF